MRNFLRSPLSWLVAAEVIVVGTLGIVIWNVVQNAGRPVLASPRAATNNRWYVPSAETSFTTDHEPTLNLQDLSRMANRLVKRERPG